MVIVIGLWKLLAWCLTVLDADQIAGRHRGSGRAFRTGYRSLRTGTLSAMDLVQWLIAERSEPGLSFVDWTRRQRWREHRTWNEIRMAAGGW